MHIVDKYRELGSYRAAAKACGVDHHTVKRVVDRAETAEADVPRRQPRERNYDAVADLVNLLVVTKMPVPARSFCIAPRRSRTSDTGTGLLYRLAWMMLLR